MLSNKVSPTATARVPLSAGQARDGGGGGGAMACTRAIDPGRNYITYRMFLSVLALGGCSEEAY